MFSNDTLQFCMLCLHLVANRANDVVETVGFRLWRFCPKAVHDCMCASEISRLRTISYPVEPLFVPNVVVQEASVLEKFT